MRKCVDYVPILLDKKPDYFYLNEKEGSDEHEQNTDEATDFEN